MIICLGTTPAVSQTMRFDGLVRDAVNRTPRVTRSPAGKAVNVARAAQVMDAQVLAMGFLGGETGRFIRRELNAMGVPHEFVEVDPPTRVCVTVIDDTDQTATELVEESQAVDPAAYEILFDRLTRRIGDCDVLVLSGSLPPGAPEEFYARCVAVGRAAGARTIVDATGPFLRLAVAAGPTLVKPNADELAETLGLPGKSPADVRAGIERLIDSGTQQAVITAGAAPVLYGERSADGSVRIAEVTPPAIKVVSPIGSGDAAAAGIAVAMQRDHNLDQAVRQGVALGCANAMKPVAGAFDRKTVDRLIKVMRTK